MLAAFCCLPFYALAQDTLKVGIIKYKTREKVMESYTPLMNYLGAQLDQKVEIMVLPDEESGYEAEDLAYLLAHNDFDLGIFTVFPYLGAKVDFPELSVFATHEVNGSDRFYGNILVRKNEKMDNLADLEGKRFLFVKPTSTSGFKYPNGIFKEHSIDIEHGFFNYDFSYDHVTSIEKLNAGEVDGVAVDESRIKKAAGVNPDDLKVLERYEVPYHAYVFSPEMTEESRKKIKEVMFKAHLDPRARGIFNNSLGIEKWVRKSDDYYNIIRRYLRIVREKPYVQFQYDISEAAEKKFQEHDLLSGMSNRMQRLLLESNRFSDQPSHYHRMTPLIKFSLVSGQFHYQLLLDDMYMAEGDVSEDGLINTFPEIVIDNLLSSQNLESHLLYNGEDWFITYGANDGINLEDYQFETEGKSGPITLNKGDIKIMDDLNTFFNTQDDFVRGAPVHIRYTATNSQPEEHTIDISGNWNIFSSAFWVDAHFWDKLGLIVGVVMAIVSALLGRYFAQRKKRRFKNILYQTNELIKEYLEGHYKLENKLLDQKDFIGKCFEKGNINEQQFLMLNQRIDDLHAIVERHQSNDISLSTEHSEAIRDIIKDGKITETEFAKIMTILRKGLSSTSPQTS